ncbi:MAG: hypothetical protein B6D41_00660 [Chloroflexi bacterium UTCFX4]|jgi:hypothetical protein|nr:MAG: hypothetical protein B6D41_00660 [Chloroflexi bacterium UTCFX4]
METSLWNEFAETVAKQDKRPYSYLAQLVREYLEEQADLVLFEEMRRDARGRIKTDAEAVRMVKEIRRARAPKNARHKQNGKTQRASARRN